MRVDSHAYTNYFVPPNYDSMIGKLICHGATRDQALARMRTALSETVVEGIQTNIPLHRELMVDAKFIEGGTGIHYLEGWLGQHKRLSARAARRPRPAAWVRAEAMHELVLRAPEALVEPVSDALVDELGALSVSVEDADAGSRRSVRCSANPACPTEARLAAIDAARTVRRRAGRFGSRHALLAQDSAAGLAAAIAAAAARPGLGAATQSQFEPVAIADGFWVVPSWHAVPAGAQRVIRLDPGLAFGTGTHPTTRMCLRWLAAQAATLAAPGLRVLDYGCGSGILAIGAALHGASDIDAVDIDPAAVQATEDNAAANGVRLRAGLPEAVERPLRRGAGQHPGHAAEAAGAAAVRQAAASGTPGAGRHPGAPGR